MARKKKKVTYKVIIRMFKSSDTHTEEFKAEDSAKARKKTKWYIKKEYGKIEGKDYEILSARKKFPYQR